jgi:hypothetical protein
LGVHYEATNVGQGGAAIRGLVPLGGGTVRVYTAERARRRDETIARLVRDHSETLSRLA